MRYIVNENNYVTAVIFGAEVLYNDCTCTEYTGGVPSGWKTLDDWYFDEGDKLWRWQIIDGDLTMDESAVAPQEGTWLGPDICEAVKVKGGSATKLEVALPEGTDKLACFFMYLSEVTTTNDFGSSRLLSMYVSVLESRIDVVTYTGSRPTFQDGNYDGLTFEDGVVEFNLQKICGGVVYFLGREYTIYPFYLK